MDDNFENKNIIQNIPDDKVIVKASDIIKKLRSPKDRHNFALENSKYVYYY